MVCKHSSALPGETSRESYWDGTNEVAPRREVKVLRCRMLLLLLAYVAHTTLLRYIPVAAQYTSLAVSWRLEAGAMSAVLGRASDPLLYRIRRGDALVQSHGKVLGRDINTKQHTLKS